MPVDKNGRRADLVMDAGSTINRMNLGRLYEQYLGSAAVDLSDNIRQKLGLPVQSVQKALKAIVALNRSDPCHINDVYSHLLGFYQIVSPLQHKFFSNDVTADERLQHLADIVSKGIYVFYPIDNDVECTDMVRNIEKYYTPTYGPVSYVGNSGQRVTTEEPVRIGPLYMMLLEKIADDGSSVSSGKLQHFGILSPMTKAEKYAYPYRNSPIRSVGETEARIFAGYCGREAIAEMLDRSNSPTTHRSIVWRLLTSDKPSNIDRAVDREAVPLGASKPLAMVNHVAICAGWRPVYKRADARVYPENRRQTDRRGL